MRSVLGMNMPEWEAEFGWTRAVISAGGSLALITMAIVAPLSGFAIDRYGPKKLLFVGLGCICTGTFLLPYMSRTWEFFLYFGVISAIGFGVVAIHVITTIIAQHFDKHRGLATGLATAGATGGQLAAVPLFAVLLEDYGWRDTYLYFAYGTVALLLLVIFSLRNNHHSMKTEQDKKKAGKLPQSIARLIKSPIFHILFWSFTICGFTTTGVIETHFLPYASFCGFLTLPSATAYGILSLVNLLGMIAAGYLSDRTHRVRLLAFIYIMRAFSFVLLMHVVDSYVLLVAFAVLFGLFDYATVPVTASLVASHIGIRHMGFSMGLLGAGHALGAALGAFVGGKVYELFVSYEFVWIASAGLSFLAGLIVMMTRSHHKLAPLAPHFSTGAVSQ